MMKLNSNVACIEYKNKVILANKLTGMWLRITKEIYNYFIKALELNYERKDFVRSFMREEDQIYIGKLLDKMEEIGILGDAEFFFQKSVAFEITNRCNLTCMHCCFSAGKQGEEMTTQRVTEILQKIIKWQPDKITITGGEPLLRNDLLEHLKFLREAFEGIIILATNGTLIHKGNVSDIIQYIDRIDISVDGVDEESSRKIRGRGVFAKVLKSVELLKLNGSDSISLSMVLTEDNEKLEEQFLDLNRKLGTFPVLRRISWIGRALENQKQLTSSGVLYEHGAEIKKDEKCMCTYGNCQNLVSKYHIRYDGYVYACQTIEDRKYSLGHIDQISEFDKITNNNLMLMIEDLLKFNHKCRRCKVMPFCWKCPVEIMEYTKNGSMREHCNTVHDNLFHVIWEE